MPDFECTFWPDNWFGYSLTNCCIVHDHGGTDFELFNCISNIHPSLYVIGGIMFIGLRLLGPTYRLLRTRR